MEPGSQLWVFGKVLEFARRHWSETVRIATLFFALSGLGVVLDHYIHISPLVYLWCCILGMISLSVLFVALLFKVASKSVRLVGNKWESLLFPSPRYCLQLADDEDLEHLFLKFKEEFGDEAPSMTSIIELHRHNPQTFWKFADPRTDDKPSRIRGTLKLLTVKRKVLKGLDAGLINGRSLTTRDITKASSRPAGVYVGGLIGDLPVRSLLMAQVVFLLYGYALGGIPIYARPLKVPGLRCLLKFGFRPVKESGLGHVYRLDRESFEAAASKHHHLFRYFVKRRFADLIQINPPSLSTALLEF